MTNSQLNLARSGESALGAEFTSSYGPAEAERLVPEDGARSAQPSGNNRVNILGVGAMPLDLDKALAMLEQWRTRAATRVCLPHLRAWPSGGAARPDNPRCAQSLRLGGRGRDAVSVVVAPRRFLTRAASLRLGLA